MRNRYGPWLDLDIVIPVWYWALVVGCFSVSSSIYLGKRSIRYLDRRRLSIVGRLGHFDGTGDELLRTVRIDGWVDWVGCAWILIVFGSVTNTRLCPMSNCIVDFGLHGG